MRRTFLVALSLLAPAVAGCADKPAPHDTAPVAAGSPAPHDTDPAVAVATSIPKDAGAPIPQDTDRIEKRFRERLKWNRRTIQGAYDKVGKKDPRWDEPARAAMELAARLFSPHVEPESSPDEVHEAARAAIAAGCDDPLVVYLHNRTSVGPNYPGPEEAIRRDEAAAEALSASGYPAFRRAVAFRIAGISALSGKAPSDADREQAGRHFDAALALLPASVAGDERTASWEDTWYDTLSTLVRGYRQLGDDAPAAYEKIDAELAKLPELAVLRLQVRGGFWFSYGWEARTTAFAPAVPAGGFESLAGRLGIAKEAFEEAWRLRPDDARTAASLLDIDKAAGGDRATMELWFDRAMKADGYNRSACWAKLDWLDPKWHGTAEEMVAFGRACRATKNWRAGITLLAADAHYRHSTRLEAAEMAGYLRSPEVWSDIGSVYDEYLKHRPDDAVARSKYASLCYLAARYPAAHAQFQAVGDGLTSWTEAPYIPLESLKRMRDYSARVVAALPGGGGAPANP